jgi:hypothetical protein
MTSTRHYCGNQCHYQTNQPTNQPTNKHLPMTSIHTTYTSFSSYQASPILLYLFTTTVLTITVFPMHHHGEDRLQNIASLLTHYVSTYNTTITPTFTVIQKVQQMTQMPIMTEGNILVLIIMQSFAFCYSSAKSHDKHN